MTTCMDLMLLLLLLVIELGGGIIVPYMNLLRFERGTCGGEGGREGIVIPRTTFNDRTGKRYYAATSSHVIRKVQHVCYMSVISTLMSNVLPSC